jgi:hypothetical protein
MPTFKPNTPIVQKEPPLPLGANRFRLVVVDEAGNESEPVFLDVVVRDTEKPTAVLDVVDASGRRVEPVMSFGQSFILTGARSTDVGGGKVAEYRFTLMG